MAKPKIDANGETREVSIDVELHKKFKAKCAELGETMRDRIEGLIRSWLQEKGARV
jgi:hypothetical protein